MDLSPNDIRNYEFQSQMRGYDKDAVDSFLDQVAEAMDQLKQENLKLSLEIDSVNKQLVSLRQYEDTIKGAAIDARRNADNTVSAAKDEATAILEVAKSKAIALIGSRAEQAEQLNNQLSQLEMVRNSYLEKLRELIQSHMEIVREIEEVDPAMNELPQIPTMEDFDFSNSSDGIEVTDSSEVDSSKLETIATKPARSEDKKYEEASEPGDIMPVHNESDETSRAESTEDVVDADLAAAIGKYKSEDDFSGLGEGPDIDGDIVNATNSGLKTPVDDEWVQTDRPAEEVPPEFIPVDHPSAAPGSHDTGRIPVQNRQDPLAVDTAKVKKQAANGLDPEALASELDAVAAKFEEEMNRAESKS